MEEINMDKQLYKIKRLNFTLLADRLITNFT